MSLSLSRSSRAIALGVVFVLLSIVPARGFAQSEQSEKLAERARRAGEIITELVKTPDHAPPRSLLKKATCVAAVPEVVQVGFGVGGKVGYGLVSCRTASGWSLPSYMALKGGSFGLQIGGQAADVVLVFLNQNAPRTIASSSFDLGGQVSVAAGPVGRNLSAETDYKLNAEIYSYSKTKGLFAGIDLSGTKWEIDEKGNKAVYGEQQAGDVKTLLAHSAATGPATIQPFVKSLETNVPH